MCFQLVSTDVDICSERKDDDSELPCIPERANVLIAEILGTMLVKFQTYFVFFNYQNN